MRAPAPPPSGYRIVSVQVANIKRLRFVEIDDLGNMVVVAGRNGQGKSSLLDSIMWGLGGGNTFRDVERPIRDGAKKGTIRLDLADAHTGTHYHVERVFTSKDNNRLTVEDDNGPVKNPQAVLSSLIGQHSFDPFAFLRLKKADQRDTLLSVVTLDVDLDALAERRAAIYAERTIVGRQRDALAARLDAIPTPPADLPDEEVESAGIVAELRAAREVVDANRALHRAVVDAEGAVEDAVEGIANLDREIDELEQRLATLRERRAGRDDELAALRVQLSEAQQQVEGLVDPDLAAIEERLEGLETLNRRVRSARDWRVLSAEFDAAKDEYEGHTRSIEGIDEEKVAALERAVMPIAGLTFDDDGLYFTPEGADRAIPLGQCSDSEQLRVSVAIAVALNPRLRFARVKEGGLLDRESLLLLRRLADEHNFQLWVELPRDDVADEDWIVLEDGAVKEEVEPT